MKSIIYIKNKLTVYAFVAMLFAFLFFMGFGGVSSAHAAESDSKYSDVLNDFAKDSAFTVENYPEKDGDYSVNVVQIAESVNGELFVYVYSPTPDLKATSINIATDSGGNEYRIYSLSPLSIKGTLGKYLVNDFTVKNELVRQYYISALRRKWDKGIDEEPKDGNTVSEVAYTVGKLFSATTVDGKIIYDCKGTETIEIIKKYCGYIRYSNGFTLFPSACNSHFVAFDTDRPIDKLMEADVYYVSKPYTYTENSWVDITGGHVKGTWSYGDITEEYVYLNHRETGAHTGMGLFAPTYTWKRIESVESFLENEEIPEENKAHFDGMKWVLRFSETDFSQSVTAAPGSSSTTYVETGTKIEDVSILRLKFETAGQVYNLGVVDNKQTESPLPDKDHIGELDVSTDGSCFGFSIKSLLMMIAIVVLFVLFFPILVPLLGWLIKGIIWLVCLPFKAIGKLIKNKKEKQ